MEGGEGNKKRTLVGRNSEAPCQRQQLRTNRDQLPVPSWCSRWPQIYVYDSLNSDSERVGYSVGGLKENTQYLQFNPTTQISRDMRGGERGDKHDSTRCTKGSTGLQYKHRTSRRQGALTGQQQTEDGGRSKERCQRRRYPWQVIKPCVRSLLICLQIPSLVSGVRAQITSTYQPTSIHADILQDQVN